MRLEFEQFELQKAAAKNFELIPLELKDYIDFEVKRVYFIIHPTSDTNQHCHLKEKELFVVQSGSCVAVIDRGNGLEDIPLRANSAIYVGAYIWHGFKNLSKDLVLLAISSTNYNPNREDYIEDYTIYKQEIAKL